jgi:hypothetical protein
VARPFDSGICLAGACDHVGYHSGSACINSLKNSWNGTPRSKSVFKQPRICRRPDVPPKLLCLAYRVMNVIEFFPLYPVCLPHAHCGPTTLAKNQLACIPTIVIRRVLAEGDSLLSPHSFVPARSWEKRLSVPVDTADGTFQASSRPRHPPALRL